MIWVEKQLKYLLYLLKELLKKYEYLTGEDLGHRWSVLEKTNFEYSPFGMSLSKSLKKKNVANISNKESDFNCDSKYKFYRFYKQHDDFEDISLDFRHNNMKEFKRPLDNFKSLKPLKQETQLKKERIMKNVYEVYKEYYKFYKNDFDYDDNLSEVKKKKIDYKQFKLFNKIDKQSKLTALPKWLHSKNDFKKAIKLIEVIRADTNNFKSNGDKKVFNDLNEFINNIKKQQNRKKSAIRRTKAKRKNCFSK